MALHERLGLMRDLLEHMDDCCQDWQSSDERFQSIFANAIRRDLTEFRRICNVLFDERNEASPAVLAVC